MHRRQRIARPSRHGFTLIELLVVIVILGILIGLLVPAVMRAVGTAKEAACAAEIRAMSQSLADFNSKFGCYPPSRIVVAENGDYSIGTSGNLGTADTPAALLAPRSVSYLRRIWPRLQFNTGATQNPAPGITASNYYDVNGNGQLDGTPYVLDGTQCLVLFLGGIPQQANATSSTTGWSMTGFSKNPANPFQPTGVTTNRTVPLYEFNNSRLVGVGFPGFIDSLGTDPNVTPYYAYFSAYGGVGYDPDDVDGAEADSTGLIPKIAGAFTSGNAPTPSIAYGGKIVGSYSPNPYTSDPPVQTDGSGDVASPQAKSPAWINPQTFQIISPGRDRVYGIGGQYLANANDRLPFVGGTGYAANTVQTAKANLTVTKLGLDLNTRQVEKDNVANFSAGKLD